MRILSEHSCWSRIALSPLGALEKKAELAPFHQHAPIAYESLLENTLMMTTIRRKADKANSIKVRFARVHKAVASLLELVGKELGRT